MKKCLLVLSIVSLSLVSAITHAQIKKGATLIGGNVGGSSTDIDNPMSADSKIRNIYAGVSLGKAVRENLIIGGMISYGGRKEERYNSSYDMKARNYQVGVFARKYKQIASSAFYLLGTGTLSANFVNTDYSNFAGGAPDYKTKRAGVRASIAPGLSYAMTKCLHLETGFNNLLAIGYETERREESAGITKGKSFYGDINISNNSQFYLGLTLLLN